MIIVGASWLSFPVFISVVEFCADGQDGRNTVYVSGTPTQGGTVWHDLVNY